MKLSLSKSPILVTLVVVGLAAGTVLVAGYVDQPTQAAKVCAAGKCDACPRQGTNECCEVTGVCAEGKACGGCEAEGACGSLGEQEAQPACSMAPACPAQAQSPCGAGGCCPDAK